MHWITPKQHQEKLFYLFQDITNLTTRTTDLPGSGYNLCNSQN